jgi:hypothetical protein
MTSPLKNVSTELNVDPSNDQAEWPCSEKVSTEICDDTDAYNRAVVFAALAEAGIRTVIVKFQGGDEYDPVFRIDSTYRGLYGEDKLEFPDAPATLKFRKYEWNRTTLRGTVVAVVDKVMTLKVAIGTVCEDYIQENEEDWLWNSDIFGTFVFDSTNKTIKPLDLYERQWHSVKVPIAHGL